MKATVPFAVSDLPVSQEGLLAWANREVLPVLKQTRQAANYRGTERNMLQTTDGTATTIWTQEMPTACGWHVEYLILGAQSDGSNVARYRETKLLKRAAGAPTVSATVSIEAAFEDVGAWDFAFTAAAAGVLTLTVTGAAATTINWVAFVQVLEAVG